MFFFETLGKADVKIPKRKEDFFAHTSEWPENPEGRNGSRSVYQKNRLERGEF